MKYDLDHNDPSPRHPTYQRKELICSRKGKEQ